MVLSLGVEVDHVLTCLGVSEAQVLLLLSARCIFILAERVETVVRARYTSGLLS